MDLFYVIIYITLFLIFVVYTIFASYWWPSFEIFLINFILHIKILLIFLFLFFSFKTIYFSIFSVNILPYNVNFFFVTIQITIMRYIVGFIDILKKKLGDKIESDDEEILDLFACLHMNVFRLSIVVFGNLFFCLFFMHFLGVITLVVEGDFLLRILDTCKIIQQIYFNAYRCWVVLCSIQLLWYYWVKFHFAHFNFFDKTLFILIAIYIIFYIF